MIEAVTIPRRLSDRERRKLLDKIERATSAIFACRIQAERLALAGPVDDLLRAQSDTAKAFRAVEKS